MTSTGERIYLWRRFTLREALLLGFCATFIILTRAGLRLHLHLPGHVMFFTMFFFLLARGCVPKIGAVTLVGLITCLASLERWIVNVRLMRSAVMVTVGERRIRSRKSPTSIRRMLRSNEKTTARILSPLASALDIAPTIESKKSSPHDQRKIVVLRKEIAPYSCNRLRKISSITATAKITLSAFPVQYASK